MNRKQQAFVEFYLRYWNATKAAELAGYAHPRQQGSRLLTKVDIQAAIQERLNDLQLSADEVLVRLAEQARGSMADFVSIDPETGEIKISLVKIEKDAESGEPRFILANEEALRRVKKIKLDAEGLTIELYSAQEALKLIGQHHQLFTQKHVVETPDLRPLPEALRELADRVYGAIAQTEDRD